MTSGIVGSRCQNGSSVVYHQFLTLGLLGWLYSQADSVLKVQKDQQPLQASVPPVYRHTEQVKARQVLRHTSCPSHLAQGFTETLPPPPSPGLGWPSLLAQAPLDHLAQWGKTSDSASPECLHPAAHSVHTTNTFSP